MSDVKVTDSVLYVGCDDLDIDLFESQYHVPNGVSYNSYVILDEKIAIMDTVDPRRTEEWLGKVEKALGGRLPDYLVVQHMEPDHAGSIQKICTKYPQMQICLLYTSPSMQLPSALCRRISILREFLSLIHIYYEPQYKEEFRMQCDQVYTSLRDNRCV